MGFQLGGAVYTHAIAEGKPGERYLDVVTNMLALIFCFQSGDTGGCVLFGLLTTAGLILTDRFEVPTAVSLLLLSAAGGFGSGYIITALGGRPHEKKEDPPASPVKWQQKRGF